MLRRNIGLPQRGMTVQFQLEIKARLKGFFRDERVIVANSRMSILRAVGTRVAFVTVEGVPLALLHAA